ncbi:MAG: PAS domain S-box protein [Deltaproteobacteria bacterium]|nr:PAS domain S-box protein [Deltaproteobacteria bacterium]
MQFFPIKKLYLPALSIVAVGFLLLILISISTYRNLDRQKTMALSFLHRQGEGLILSLEASARTGMKTLMWQEISFGSLLQETAKSKDIAYVYITDEHGTIAHHSDPLKTGALVDWKLHIAEEGQIDTRIKTLSDSTQIYELAKIFSPMYEPTMMHHRNSQIGLDSGHMANSHSHRGDTIILGMRMTVYEQARHADIQHAFIMAAIILILGSGALFFIFVIQNYYLVDKTLKQTKDYTREVVANMANGLLSIDSEGKIVSFNFLALELLGIEESEAKGMDLRTSIDFVKSGIESTLIECVPVLDFEIYHQHKAGEMVPLALSATPIKDQKDGYNGAVIVLRDLRELKLLQEKVKRSEKLAAIGELAAGVAHEIRNPLSSIRGFAQFLRHSLKDKPQEKEYAETMVTEIDRINRVVTDLLTFARPMAVEISPTDITELIEHSVRLVEADALSRDVNIQMKISDLTRLPLDANQITQALLNLLLNALQAVPPKGNIEIGAELDPSDSRLHLWVKDDGPGIPNNKIEKIFEPFYTTHEKGTGLGLAIVHKIAENHNGEIRVNSPPKGMTRGCCVSIILPIIVSRKTGDEFKRTENKKTLHKENN